MIQTFQKFSLFQPDSFLFTRRTVEELLLLFFHISEPGGLPCLWFRNLDEIHFMNQKNKIHGFSMF